MLFIFIVLFLVFIFFEILEFLVIDDFLVWFLMGFELDLWVIFFKGLGFFLMVWGIGVCFLRCEIVDNWEECCDDWSGGLIRCFIFLVIVVFLGCRLK